MTNIQEKPNNIYRRYYNITGLNSLLPFLTPYPPCFHALVFTTHKLHNQQWLWIVTVDQALANIQLSTLLILVSEATRRANVWNTIGRLAWRVWVKRTVLKYVGWLLAFRKGGKWSLHEAEE